MSRRYILEQAQRAVPEPERAQAVECLAHRCEAHEGMPPINSEGPQLSECAICVGQTFANAYANTFEQTVFWPLIESARRMLNFLSPGAGEAYVEEARAALLAGRVGGGPPTVN